MLKDDVIKALRTVRDPEIPVSIYELGLVYDLDVSDDGSVGVRMTLTTPNCPVAEMIPAQVERAVRSVKGVSEVKVELVWEPAWTPDRMSEAARLQLNMQDLPTPGSRDDDVISPGSIKKSRFDPPR